jgi:phage head maturation protease
VRSRFGDGSLELRAAEGSDPTGPGTDLVGHFSKFGAWYEVDSLWEGNFLERVGTTAFDKTIAEDRDRMRVLFDHGFDFALGDKPLGPIRELKNDGVGAWYEVPLLDTDYNRNFVLPALEGRLMDGGKAGSQLGASFQFMVTGETWDRSGKATSNNPKGLPKRTITEAKVFEFGPVTFPASPSASAGVRSGTDEFIDHLLHDTRFVAALVERSSPAVVKKMLARVERQAPTQPAPDEEAQQTRAAHVAQLRRRAQVILRNL